MVKEFKIKYSIIDIETTGGKFNHEKITEIAILRINDNNKVDVLHKLINPIKKIQPFVEKLTGLNNKMLKNKPIFSDVAVEIQDFTKNSIFVAHNVNFDYRVLRKEFKSVGIEFSKVVTNEGNIHANFCISHFPAAFRLYVIPAACFG